MSDRREPGRSSRPAADMGLRSEHESHMGRSGSGHRTSVLTHPLTKPLALLLTVALAAGSLGYAIASLRLGEMAKREAAKGEQMRQRISFLEGVAARQALSDARAQDAAQGPVRAEPVPAPVVHMDALPHPQVQALSAIRPITLATAPSPAPQQQTAPTRRPALPSPETRSAKESANAREMRQPKPQRTVDSVVAANPATQPPTPSPSANGAGGADSQIKQVKTAGEKPSQVKTAGAPASPGPGAESGVVVASMMDAGVLEVRADGLKLKNGKTVKVGERFETGETLISINAAEKRIQTDRRVLMLL